ncbi:hypothetical protein B0H15DRAFT_947315 [Mycena belliarum]|uniref:Uncharacterized protein n=1 Tax=Mycena belliarum TaxID=1033014 RepID=A0AAD6U7I9_9AGAR|nr:hypothetical protein B0H15DRAFT_947315 [Mycena belliae]
MPLPIFSACFLRFRSRADADIREPSLGPRLLVDANPANRNLNLSLTHRHQTQAPAHTRTRRPAEQAPPLSPTTTNLFDTFPRVLWGGYRRYYDAVARAAFVDLPARDSSLPSDEDEEDPWSWDTLPAFNGKTARCRLRRAPPRPRHSHSCPRLRKKPRLRTSALPLVVDATDRDRWPAWVAEFVVAVDVSHPTSHPTLPSPTDDAAGADDCPPDAPRR